MELKKIKHYVHRTYQLGPRGSVALIHNRLKNQLFHTYWRAKARNKKAAHSWKNVINKHYKKSFEDFDHFWSCQQKRLDLFIDELKLSVDSETVFCQANDYGNNFFSVLGSSKKQFLSLPWHTDIRLQEIDPLASTTFDPVIYYKDVTITPGQNNFVKDIKVPWELSRLQHFFVFGYAYQQSKNECYANAFVDHYNDWLTHNSFMLGTNWSCPMDVGIRAVNLVWALFFFKECKSLSSDFLEKITTNLYDHFFYLENNWEMYDDLRSSNHYLSDLIGYFYLCYFFYDLPGISKKAEWCYQELLIEFEKQIFPDGTDYEGSTTYHLLIAEIFYHFYRLGITMGFVFNEKFLSKLSAMFSYIDWCTPNEGKMITIGDNDSGKLLYYGIDKELIKSLKKPKINDWMHFKNFGISIIKTDAIHYSLRHHVYQDRQPTGHFHNDFGSITLAIQGTDIFVDPGSYLYTPSAQWRNKFRSVEAHSTFFLKDCEPLDFGDLFFDHGIPEQKFLEEWVDKNDSMIVHTDHSLYKEKYGLIPSRTVVYDREIRSLKITDIWKADHGFKSPLVGCWNFTLNPDIRCHKVQDFFLFESPEDKALATFQSNINFELKDCYVSLAYGTKVASKQLQASVDIKHNVAVVTIVTLI